MCFGEIGSELHCLRCQTRSLGSLFCAEIETGKSYQPLRITTKFRFNGLRSLCRSFRIAAEVKIDGNLSYDSGEQLLRGIGRSLGDCQHELFDTACTVAFLQSLIAYCRVSA